jgi:hypothetical protein
MKSLTARLDALFNAHEAQRTEQQRENSRAMARAKRIAAKHGILIERDHKSWWVTCPALERAGIPDPCEGAHFCSDGQEVLEKVEVYATAILGRPA